MTANQKLQKADNFNATGPGCLPTPQVLTGTLVSSGTTVTGTGTNFTKDILRGMYIYSSLNNAVRRVAYVNSATELVLSSAFTTPMAGETFKYPFSGHYRSVACVNTGGATGIFNESPLANTDPMVNINNEYGLAPIAYDATGTTFYIETGT